MHYIIVAVFMLIAPAVSSAVELMMHGGGDPWLTIAKWFVVWSVGVRLFTAGIKQVTDPSFTASILHITSKTHWW